MASRDVPAGDFDGGLNSLICQEDVKDVEHHPDQDRRGDFMFSLIPSKHGRLVAACLVILAAVLLVVDISLGVHYNNLTDTHLTLDDVQHINGELIELQDTYKIAIRSTKDAKKQLDSQLNLQKQSNWESEHHTKRSNDYEVQIEAMKKDIEEMRSHLPLISDGCKYCPYGWIMMNSLCYYFSSPSDPLKSWENAREACQLQGGDLAVVDSKDKQMAILNHVKKDGHGYFIGLRDLQKNGLWQWPNGTILVEGYWRDGELNNRGIENCVTLHSNENFFKSWNDDRCTSLNKWICDKAPNL